MSTQNKDTTPNIFILDSLKSPNEWEYVASQIPSKLVGIVCDDNLRIERIRSRNSQVKDIDIAYRDAIDLGLHPDYDFNIPALVSRSDYIIQTERPVKGQIEEIIGEIYGN